MYFITPWSIMNGLKIFFENYENEITKMNHQKCTFRTSFPRFKNCILYVCFTHKSSNDLRPLIPGDNKSS